MEESTLRATHVALHNLLWKCNIWNIYAYVPSQYSLHLSPIWKIKTKKYNYHTARFSFDALKYYDSATGKRHTITFKFGYQEVKRVPDLTIKALQLEHNHLLEREIVEKICQLSDAGYVITSNKEIILDKFKGTEFLINIDLEAPDYELGALLHV